VGDSYRPPRPSVIWGGEEEEKKAEGREGEAEGRKGEGERGP